MIKNKSVVNGNAYQSEANPYIDSENLNKLLHVRGKLRSCFEDVVTNVLPDYKIVIV